MTVLNGKSMQKHGQLMFGKIEQLDQNLLGKLKDKLVDQTTLG